MGTSQSAGNTNVVSRGLFVLISIGATFAFLPSILGLLSILARDCHAREDFLVPFLIQAVGALMMFLGFLFAYKKVRKYQVRNSGFLLATVTCFIGMGANLIFGICNSEKHLNLALKDIEPGTAILVAVFLLVNLLMAIACFKISRYFSRYGFWGAMFILTFLTMTSVYVIWNGSFRFPYNSTIDAITTRHNIYEYRESDNEYSDYYNYSYNHNSVYATGRDKWYYEGSSYYQFVDSHRLMPKGVTGITCGMTFLSLLLAWIASIIAIGARPQKRLRDIVTKLDEEKLASEIADINVQTSDDWQCELIKHLYEAEYGNERTAQTDHSQYMPKSEVLPDTPSVRIPPKAPSEVSPSTPQPELPADIVNQLMHCDNGRLQEIIDKPAFYNPAVVTKARELLGRRQAWEQISNLPDTELMSITMATKGIYTDEIVEAAAMELFQRNSSVLRDEFMNLSPDVLASIAKGTAPAPEGIRLAAQSYLSKNMKF